MVDELLPAHPPKPASIILKRRAKSKVLVNNRNIILSRDYFGTIYDEDGTAHYIKRFTWKNHNNIQVQVITYGARITSICLPGRNGVVVDVALGYEDIAGCLYYEEFPFGATIGRFTNKIENATFAIDGKQYWLVQNDDDHHKDGGCKGFDKVVWKSYVDDTKVILTHVSPNKDQGYPGDLFVRITYELTPKNEFKVNMEAITSKPTIVNLSNLLYLNLAGHYAGPSELNNHVVTINANCYTKMKGDGLPNGKIMNVIYTKNDFMTPTLLKDVIGITPDDGYDQNFCVNRGVDQDLCFIGRVLHVPSGRIMEIYSNQYGVNFSTANNLGSGFIDILQSFGESTLKVVNSDTDPFDLINRLHEKMKNVFDFDTCDIHYQLRRLIRNLYRMSTYYKGFTTEPEGDLALKDFKNEEEKEINEEEEVEEESVNSDDIFKDIQLTKIQKEYLELMETLSIHSTTNYDEIKQIIGKVLRTAETIHSEQSKLKMLVREENKVIEEHEEEEQEVEVENESIKSVRNLIKRKSKGGSTKTGFPNVKNEIPEYYKDGRIHGKGNVIYKRHCALSLQTQNYPNAIYHKNFPNCILRPGETYKHTTVYKFWVQGGVGQTHSKKVIKKEVNDKNLNCI